jgi:hypothetical protein
VSRNTHRRLIAGFFALSASLALCMPAVAAPIQLGGAQGTEYFHAGELVRPASFEVTEFVSAVAGTVTLSVTRIEWGDLFSQLSTSVSLLNRQDLQFAGNALSVFDVTAGEHFATSIYAQAAGPLGFGAYRLDVLFLAKNAQVPLPPAAWLMLSGLGAWFMMARRRREVAARA